jgi:hypothetical protein
LAQYHRDKAVESENDVKGFRAEIELMCGTLMIKKSNVIVNDHIKQHNIFIRESEMTVGVHRREGAFLDKEARRYDELSKKYSRLAHHPWMALIGR